MLFVLASSCALAAKFPRLYIPDQRYRYSEADTPCSRQNLCYSNRELGEGLHRYSLNFVEYRDNGELFDQAELDAALTQLDNARKTGQHVIVFIYIHGWHNNAGERKNDLKKKNCSDNLYDGDVAKFEYCGLQVIADKYPSTPGAKAPRVVGIYLAWHGEDFTPWAAVIPYYVPSYIFRRHYAYKIGQTGMEKGLQQILYIIQQHRRSYFVIAMGHSFGARALENADLMLDPKYPKPLYSSGPNADSQSPTPQPALGLPPSSDMQAQISTNFSEEPQLLPPQVPLSQLPESELPIDLVFYVNAATSSYRTVKVINDWNDKCNGSPRPDDCRQDPLYFAVSSRADVLTAIVMPIANLVFPAWSTDRFHIISAANTPWMQTHSLPRRILAAPETLAPDAFCFMTTDGSNKYLYEVEPKDGRSQKRFWVMNSDHRYAALEGMLHKIPFLRRAVRHDWIISAHGDVWNRSVFNMIYALIETQQTPSNKRQAKCYEETKGMQFVMQ